MTRQKLAPALRMLPQLSPSTSRTLTTIASSSPSPARPQAQQQSLSTDRPSSFRPQLALTRYQQTRALQTTASRAFNGNGQSPLLGAIGGFGGSGSGMPSSYFQKPALPANTIIRFVPQQTAWIVERMGKYDRILEPGLAILIPFIDRIAYVKSLKENALEIPSQSAITADNVTLELDGVLFTRVFDAFKARYLSLPVPRPSP